MDIVKHTHAQTHIHIHTHIYIHIYINIFNTHTYMYISSYGARILV
jgi:hypothetical protein